MNNPNFQHTIRKVKPWGQELKIMDALESIAYAHLRHIQKCFFVQSNIAINHANSGDGEVDLIGLQLPLKDSAKGGIFVVETTMVAKPYCGGEEMVKKLQDKFSRALAHAQSELKYFTDGKDPSRPFAIHKEFWAPKITPHEKELLAKAGAALKGLTIVHGQELLRRMGELEKMFEKDVSFGFLDIAAQFFMIRGSVRRLMNARTKAKPPAKAAKPTPALKS